ncbi:MAG: L,D-transpeptidase [Chloroflexota bacterium]
MARRTLLVAMALAIALTLLLPLGGGGTVEAAASVVVVNAGELNVRTAPSLAAPVASRVYAGDQVTVTGTVQGDWTGGSNLWYRTQNGRFLAAAYVGSGGAASTTTTVANAPYRGKWVDVNLSTLRVRAMVGNEVVYTAKFTGGKKGWETPRGHFTVVRRVAVTTMDSSTIGIYPGQRGYYRVPNVRYAQYFDWAGDALHGNYWSPRNSFGSYNTSHGCVGMTNGDAAWFWNWGYIGLPVYVHA